MENRFLVSQINEDRCTRCRLCDELIVCLSPEDCIGCQACFHGCPNQARRMVEDKEPRKAIRLSVNGQEVEVPERITIRRALERVGFSFGVTSTEGDLQAPCGTGGCYTCLVLAEGVPARACVSPVRDGMSIETSLPEGYLPLRVIHGPQPHSVGGKATPWWLKSRERYIEVAIWAAGCNLRCPQCQNFTTTYDGRSAPMTPRQAAEAVTRARHRHKVDRMAISGGEATLNRPWLVGYFKELKALNPDPEARLHLDSNGTVLTPDYIDELITEAGVTDIGIEPKGVHPETFMGITGIADQALAQRYLNTAWEAVAYVVENYRDRVFLGVGMPYNPALMSLQEVQEFGQRLAAMDEGVQLCVLDYFPTFRRRWEIRRPYLNEMLAVKRTLEQTGLKAVVVQTVVGHIGPGD
jgi:pyruvate formate lyase activating enzyme